MIIIKKAAQILIGQLCTTVEQHRVLGAAGRHAAAGSHAAGRYEGSQAVFSPFVVVIETLREIIGEGPIQSHDVSVVQQSVPVASEVLVTLQPAYILVAGHRFYTAALAGRAGARLVLLSSL